MARYTLELVTGSGDSARRGTDVIPPPVVQVLDDSRRAVPGVPVTFTVVSGGGKVDPQFVRTDAQGIATTSWTLGTNPGHNDLKAALPAGYQAQALMFTGTAT